MKLLLITTAAAVLLAAGSNAQSSWLSGIKSWLRPSRQTRPQNGVPPQNFPQASQPFPAVQQQGQQGFQVKVNPGGRQDAVLRHATPKIGKSSDGSIFWRISSLTKVNEAIL